MDGPNLDKSMKTTSELCSILGQTEGLFIKDIGNFFRIFYIPHPPCWQLFTPTYWHILSPQPLSIAEVFYGRPLCKVLDC